MSSPSVASEISQSGSSRRTLVLYEDIAASDEGLDFALRLYSEVGLDVGCPDTHWWLDMLEIPRIAAEIARQARSCDYVILSLSGARPLSEATNRWLKAWLATMHFGTTALIVVFDAQRSKLNQRTAIRTRLRQLCARNRANSFFYLANEGRKRKAIGSDWFVGKRELFERDFCLPLAETDRGVDRKANAPSLQSGRRPAYLWAREDGTRAKDDERHSNSPGKLQS